MRYFISMNLCQFRFRGKRESSGLVTVYCSHGIIHLVPCQNLDDLELSMRQRHYYLLLLGHIRPSYMLVISRRSVLHGTYCDVIVSIRRKERSLRRSVHPSVTVARYLLYFLCDNRFIHFNVVFIKHTRVFIFKNKRLSSKLKNVRKQIRHEREACCY